MRKGFTFGGMLAAAVLLAGGVALAGGPREMLRLYEKQAKEAGIMPKDGFSAERGGAFFAAKHSGGKPATPSCTTCHTDSPHKTGKTRTGKPIEPMALSKTPDRYSDPEKVEKWFRRNCRSVLGRECTPVEKGDFLTFMIGQ